MSGFYIVARNDFSGLTFVFSDYPIEHLFPIFTTDLRKGRSFVSVDEAKGYAKSMLSNLGYSYIYIEVVDCDF